MDTETIGNTQRTSVAGPSTVYKNYLLFVLMTVLAFNYLDRIALGVVLQDIKTDLRLSDTQLGLMSGMAFAFFYSVMGIPIARWADRANRITIISITTGLWSIAVALCGGVATFLQLLAVRVGVAVGEAGCIPPAHSLIADNFSRAERPRAVARYMLGLPISLVLGYFAAGWLNQLYGWRVTFVVISVPGLVLALMVALTLKEPRTRRSALSGNDPRVLESTPPTTLQPSVSRAIVRLWQNRSFRHLLLAFAVWYFFGYGLLQWQPTFFVRSHGLATGELGMVLAVCSGGGALLGVYLGGEWSSRYAANNERFQLVAVAVMFALFGLFSFGTYVARTTGVALTCLTIAAIGGNASQGPILATMQTLVPPRMRAFSLALVYLLANLIGMGLGPLAAGALSDALRPWAGNESLRYALLVFCPGYLWAAWHLLRASKSVSADIEALDNEDTAF